MTQDDMIREIARDMRYAREFLPRGEMGEAVSGALARVPRDRFVPDHLKAHAFDNSPLPIGSGQTISQPFIVAFMTELLDVDASSKVLEVGTGSGYQAAVLAELVAVVYSVEIVESLAKEAAARLESLGYANVHVRFGDGVSGWPEAGPFDGIIVTAAGPKIPMTLLEQLEVGARLVMPVGGEHETQYLVVVTRESVDKFSEQRTIAVRFVPITGKHSLADDEDLA